MTELIESFDKCPATAIPLELIDAIGESHFGHALMSFLSNKFGAAHFAVFNFEDWQPFEMLSESFDGSDTAHRQTVLYLNGRHWRRDPSMTAARRELANEGPSLHQLQVSRLPHTGLRDTIYEKAGICERVLLAGRAGPFVLGLSVLRCNDRGLFTPDDIAALQFISGQLLSILGRHLRFSAPMIDLSLSLTSLAEIERTIAAKAKELPRREAEVCARILFGISSTGIALDLGIGEETVMTYRKRAYQRLAIGSQRELLVWYLRNWSTNRPVAALMRPPSGHDAAVLNWSPNRGIVAMIPRH